MITEAQLRKTFDIIGKWVGKQYQISIEFQPNATPMCDPVNKRIILPSNISSANIFPALAELIHEAGHIRHTTFEHPKIVQDQEEHIILNAVEDMRVDNRNMGLLPNMRGIHETLMKQCAKSDFKEKPFEVRVLSRQIYRFEGFGGLCPDKEAEEFSLAHNLPLKIHTLIQSLEYIAKGIDRYADARKQVLEIKDILYKAKEKNENSKDENNNSQRDNKHTQRDNRHISETNQDEEQDSQSSRPVPNGNQPQSQQNDRSNSPRDGDKTQGGGTDLGEGGDRQNDKLDLSKLDSHGFSDNFKTDPHARNIPEATGKEALDEMTKAYFTELLKSKEIRTINLGKKLNSSRLINYRLGDIDNLFTDDKIERPLRSKVLILMDGSGSMQESLLDNTCRYRGLSIIIENITKLLDQLNETYVEIDYDVRGFNTDYYKFNKEKWQKEYCSMVGGGTKLSYAFNEAQDELLNDYTITGKKLITIITDGEVSESQIEHIKKSILNKNEDVRLMFIGIGASPTGQFVQEISGYNILAMDMANAIILEAIMEML